MGPLYCKCCLDILDNNAAAKGKSMSLFSDNPFSRFTKGFFYPFRAFGFLNRHKKLYLYILIPLCITVAILSLFLSLGFIFFQQTIVHYIPQGEAWYWHILSGILWLFAVLITAVLVFFGFTAIGNLIASPFNDILSEKTEEALTGRSAIEPFSFAVFWSNSKALLVTELKKIGLFLLGMLVLFLLNVLPVVGSLLYGFLSIFWTILFLAVEYCGFLFFRRQLSYQEQRRIVLENFALLLGFGTGLFCILAIPFFQLLCIPLGVIGATILLLDDTLVKLPENRQTE